MSATKPARIFLAAALCLLPASSVFAIRAERLTRFSPASGRSESLEAAAGSAIVKFKAGISTAAAIASLGTAGFQVKNYSDKSAWAAVGLPENMPVQSGLQILKNFSFLETAEPNRVFRVKRVPNDPFLTSQYALSQVQAFGAWEYETGFSSRATVAFIDTGVSRSQPELADKFSGTSLAFTPDLSGTQSNDDPPVPACNHATRAAGVAAAASDNSAGIAGMSWGARLISLRVFDAADCSPACLQDTCGTTEIAIGNAVAAVTAQHNTPALGKIVINMSLGSGGTCSGYLQGKITAAVSAGLMLFAAAGNEGVGFIDSPANCGGVIAVGATDSQDKLASFSNSDTLMLTKGVTAPGVELYTTDVGGGLVTASGTSFSSPMAAGLAALVWSAKPAFTAAQVFDTMKNSADDLGAPGPDRDFGWGRINALKALRLAVTGAAQFAGTSKAVAYPNPFRPKSQRLVTFTVPVELTGSGVEVKIYTSEGELVRKLDGLAWDGRNAGGTAVASGVYLFRVKTDKDSAAGRFALIR